MSCMISNATRRAQTDLFGREKNHSTSAPEAPEDMAQQHILDREEIWFEQKVKKPSMLKWNVYH